MDTWSFEHKAIEAALTGGVSMLTLLLGWFVGLGITAKWTLRQKRRELELSAASELYRLYGEFFAVWKLWNYVRSGVVAPEDKDARWELLQRAAALDGGFEALLVKLSSERVISQHEAESAGLLRQGFQQLRQSIKQNVPLEWGSSDHPQYAEFKRLACYFANMLAIDHDFSQPSRDSAATVLRTASSNEHERNWKNLLTNA